MFKKVVIENGYEYDSMDDDGWLSYGFNIVKDSTGSKSSQWSLYNTKDDRFTFSFSRTNPVDKFFNQKTDNSQNPYDLIPSSLTERIGAKEKEIIEIENSIIEFKDAVKKVRYTKKTQLEFEKLNQEAIIQRQLVANLERNINYIFVLRK